MRIRFAEGLVIGDAEECPEVFHIRLKRSVRQGRLQCARCHGKRRVAQTSALAGQRADCPHGGEPKGPEGDKAGARAKHAGVAGSSGWHRSRPRRLTRRQTGGQTAAARTENGTNALRRCATVCWLHGTPEVPRMGQAWAKQHTLDLQPKAGTLADLWLTQGHGWGSACAAGKGAYPAPNAQLWSRSNSAIMPHRDCQRIGFGQIGRAGLDEPRRRSDC